MVYSDTRSRPKKASSTAVVSISVSWVKFGVGNEGLYALQHVPRHWGSDRLVIVVALYSPDGC